MPSKALALRGSTALARRGGALARTATTTGRSSGGRAWWNNMSAGQRRAAMIGGGVVGGLAMYQGAMPRQGSGAQASRYNQNSRVLRGIRSNYMSSGATQQLTGHSLGGLTGLR